MTTKRKLIDRRDTFPERLDAAVMAQFPTVECETSLSIFTMNLTSHWFVRGSATDDKPRGKKLTPALARQVKAFVQGFSAAEKYMP